MFIDKRRSFVASLLLCSLLLTVVLPITASARTRTPVRQAASGQDKQEKKDSKKDDSKKDDKPKLSKDEREYQKIKKFSLELYAKDSEFREDVDEAYRDTMRKHGQLAYLINTRLPASKLVTREGDKIVMEDTLYDNPLAQDYVNRVGQSLVPAGSNKLYAFKITLNPVPDARSLSTGTIYVSSGLLSAVDNEAQLAYVLGHEIAHIELEHWREDVFVDHGMAEYNEKQQKKRALIGLGLQAGLGIVGGSAVNSAGGAIALMAAYVAVPTVLKLAYPNSTVAWDRLQEDQSDDLGLKYMLNRSYDPQEVPRFYASLKNLSQRDPRVRSGFMAHTARIDERTQMVNSVLTNAAATGSLKAGLMIGAVNLAQRKMAGSPTQPADPNSSKAIDPTRNPDQRAAVAEKAISGVLSPEIQAKLDSGELIGTTAEFEAVMAALNRDNGIVAYYFDMFQMSRENLEESLRIRSNDPYAHFYYGKVLKLTARAPQDKLKALGEFASAIQYDKRGVLAEPHLYRALSMIDNRATSDTNEIVANLKQYVTVYQKQHGGDLPANIDVIYDYMQNAGEMSWAAIPAVNVSTKNIDPIMTRADSIARSVANVPVTNQEPVQTPAPTKPARKRP
jgi:predicted Zn-dependent protease